MSITGGTIQTIHEYDSPSSGRVKTNDNFSLIENNIFGTSYETLSAVTFSANTIYLSGSNIYELIEVARTGDTTMSSSTNITIVSAGSVPENYTPTLNNNITIISVSGNSISATTIYSGSTDLSSIFQAKGSDSAHTFIQNGLNSYTGGTSALPTVNVSGLTIDNITVSGSAIYNTISATTISATTIYASVGSIFVGSTKLSESESGVLLVSGSLSGYSISAGTIYSGSTDMNALFHSTDLKIDTKANVSGSTSLSASTFSANTIYSGSTDLSDIFQAKGIVSRIELTSLSAETSANNFANAGTVGEYRVDYYLVCTISESSGSTIAFNTLFNDGVSARTISSTTLDLTSNSYIQGVNCLRLGSGNVQYSTTLSGTITDSRHSIYATCEKLN